MPAEIFSLRREKLLLDTSVYISNLRGGIHTEKIGLLRQEGILYLHSTVFEELLAGARSGDLKELARLKKPFLGTGRMVTPQDEDWEETGHIINRFISRKKMNSKNAVRLTGDTLIALSARRHGIRVITENRRDFELIRAIKDFKLTIWTA